MKPETVCWPDTTRQRPPVDHSYASALWLLGRHVQLADLAARVPGVVQVDEDGPWLELDALGDAVLAHDADVAAWRDYERRRPAPDGEAAYERWQAAGPVGMPAAEAIGVMSGSERTRLRLLATFSTQRIPLRVGDFRSFDASGDALLGDWCAAVQAG